MIKRGFSKVLNSVCYKNLTLEVVHGNITQEPTETIVNAANGNLAHGGGVALAISRAGGSQIQQESNSYVLKHGPIATGQVAVTSGGELPYKYIIHAVGPVYSGKLKDFESLFNAGMNSFMKAEEYVLKSLALPAISSGIFGFPKDRCAETLITAAIQFAEKELVHLKLIRFTNFDIETASIFEKELEKRKALLK